MHRMACTAGTQANRPVKRLSLLLLSSLLIACGDEMGPSGDQTPGAMGGSGGQSPGGRGQSTAGQGGTGDPVIVTEEDRAHPQGWFGNNTISHRVDLPLAARGTTLHAQALVDQLAGYDPGSLLRCAVADSAAYRAAIDALGGVTWGYGVGVLEDLSKPRFQAGLLRYQPMFAVPGATDTNGAGAPVEIVKADIVAVTEAAALFYSRAHGLMLVDLTGSAPQFKCAIQLPGVVDQFFFHQGHLVAMVKQQPALGLGSFLVHLDVDATTLSFVETVNLGRSTSSTAGASTTSWCSTRTCACNRHRSRSRRPSLPCPSAAASHLPSTLIPPQPTAPCACLRWVRSWWRSCTTR